MNAPAADVLKAARRPRVALLSLSPIADDPRVRRQGDALMADGWDVVAFGMASKSDAPPPAWRLSAVDGPEAARFAPATPLEKLLRLVPERPRSAGWLLLARLAPRLVPWIYWHLKPNSRAMAAMASAEAFDLVVANDWPALGAGLEIARSQGAPLIYDTHEFATDEFVERGLWRFFYQPFLTAFEGWGSRQAHAVTCVADGIADALQETHRLAARPTVIRNTPPLTPVEPRIADGTVRVLYHGIVMRGRGLEACIASVQLWPEDYNLTIRGPGAEAYLGKLKVLARELGVSGRVTFAPPIAVTELVREASHFDIGLFQLPDHSLQNRFVLPNKFFEYAAAGLALCVSDLPEMSRLVRAHDLGELISGDAAEDIASAIRKLDRAAIARFRANAARAAQGLCWEHEQERFLAICRAAVEQNVPA